MTFPAEEARFAGPLIWGPRVVTGLGPLVRPYAVAEKVQREGVGEARRLGYIWEGGGGDTILFHVVIQECVARRGKE